jgi:hypothetical protein
LQYKNRNDYIFLAGMFTEEMVLENLTAVGRKIDLKLA